MSNNLGNFAIGHNAFDYIVNTSKKGVLELGSGTGSIEIGKRVKLYSIEDQKKYVNIYQENPEYKGQVFHVPIYHTWYDGFVLYNTIKDLDYDFILMDGPAKQSRLGFFYNYWMFKKVPFMIDDTHREQGQKLVKLFQEQGFKFKEIKEHNKKAHVWDV